MLRKQRGLTLEDQVTARSIFCNARIVYPSLLCTIQRGDEHLAKRRIKKVPTIRQKLRQTVTCAGLKKRAVIDRATLSRTGAAEERVLFVSKSSEKDDKPVLLVLLPHLA